MNDRASNDGTRQKLLAAILSRLESHGASGISARSVALAAGVQMSAIYHHFGDLGRLLETAQELARSQAAEWCEAILEMVDDVSGPAAMAPLLAAIPEHILLELQKPQFDLEVIKSWLERVYGDRNGKAFVHKDATLAERREFGGWAMVQCLEVDSLCPVRRRPFLQHSFFANFSTKATAVAQRGCLICGWGNRDLGPVTHERNQGS